MRRPRTSRTTGGAHGGWLRTKFTELGVIGFEDNPDTGEEYEMFQLARGEVAGSIALEGRFHPRDDPALDGGPELAGGRASSPVMS